MRPKYQNSEFKIKKYQMPKFCHLGFVTRNLFVIWILSFAILMSGCDAFVRKFTRKPKKDNAPKEEMVLVPQEYKPSMDKAQLYRQYFLFWQSWQDELIEALSQRKNHKKQIDCMQEAIKNLVNLRALLDEKKQKELDIYIGRMKDLQDSIAKDIYAGNADSYAKTAEGIKRALLREFSFHKVKERLI